jgi:hypothetical protein
MSLAMAGSISNGYTLTKSLRFRSSASAYLNRTFSTPTSATTWTISTWIKRGQLGTEQVLFGVFNSGTDYFYFGFDGSTDRLQIFDRPSSGGTNWLTTTQVFRDPSAWYHIVYVFDTTQATSTNRQKLYINGVQVTSFATQTPGTQNSVARWNASGNVGHIGRSGNSGGQAYIDMYQAELNFIDGQALTPSSFGSTNALTGVWQPAKYTGTYGTNGFYLPFTNTTSTSTLGTDFSGNSNTWTVNNISLTAGTTYDSMTDVPTLTSATVANYCVLNPLDKRSLIELTNANLHVQADSSGSWGQVRSTVAFPTTGKWYWEFVFNTGTNSFSVNGIGNSGTSLSLDYAPSSWANVYQFMGSGTLYANNTSSSYGSSLSSGDVLMVAFDRDNSAIYFGKNGTWFNSSNPATQTSPAASSISTSLTFFPMCGSVNASGGDINFGQRPFTYTPPTGFVALNTFNLPTSTIVKGNTVMDATTYTGNGTGLGSTQTISNGNFKPDLIWIKSRSTADYHNLNDSVRGIVGTGSPNLFSNTTDAETTFTGYGVSAVTSTGFTLIGNGSYTNATGTTYVGWQWQAGQGTTSNITVGQYSTSPNVPSIASTVSVNATAGFSIVTYTGTGSNATVGHGLGVAPSMIIVKRRDAGSSPWNVWQTGLSGGTYFLVLSATSAQANGPTRFTATPTSTVFNIGTDSDVNASAGTYVAYCWTSIAGYSAFGSYTGNGSTDGPFIYTGFRPRFLIIKCSSNATVWYVWDSSRDPYNFVCHELYPNTADAEYTNSAECDFLSNGFKMRSTFTDQNGSGRTYIYMAFAENPFKNALAR